MKKIVRLMVVILLGVSLSGWVEINAGEESDSPADKGESQDPLEGLTLEDFRSRSRLSRDEFTALAEEVVARVGGREIRRRNVWEVFKVSPDIDTVPPFNPRLLHQAIERELLYREALRREIDKTGEYTRRLEEEKQSRWKRRVPGLARFREAEVLRELSRTTEPAEPSEEEIEAVFGKVRPRYPKETTDGEVRESVRQLLAVQGPMLAYQKWLAGLFGEAKIEVEGKKLALDDLAQSLESFSIEQGLEGIRAGEREAWMLLEQVQELTSDQEVSSILISINGEEVEVRGERPEEEEGNATIAQDLFTTVKQYLIAQDARDRGELPEEKPVWETPPDKSILISIVLSQLVEEEPEPEVSREETVAFYQAHPRYHGMTLEGLKARMIPRIRSEKRRQSAIDRLKERFEVEILVEAD
jgi:hypothetical protein